MFTAITALSQKAYQKRLARVLQDKNAVNALASLKNIKIPKKYNTIEKIDKYLRENQGYAEAVRIAFGYLTESIPVSGGQIPTTDSIEKRIEKEQRSSLDILPTGDIINNSKPENLEEDLKNMV